MIRHPLVLFMLSLMLGLGTGGWDDRGMPVLSMAWADDDDDDNDGGGTGGGSARSGGNGGAVGTTRGPGQNWGSGGQRRTIQRQPAPRQPRAQPTRRAPAAVPAPPPPTRAENEIIARGLNEAQLTALEAEGYSIILRRDLAGGQSLVRLRKPAAVTMDDARAAIAALPGVTADFNHFYRPEATAGCSGDDCLIRTMVEWPTNVQCGAAPVIGMIDTGLNESHDALSQARITLHRIEDIEGVAQSDKVHGTGVAALLVGDADSRTPGLVPHMPLIAVDAFHKSASDERADAFALVQGLDWLAEQDVRIVNMSLAGPMNDLLSEKVGQLDDRNILIVAAAGNAGPRAAPSFPAAFDRVLAVTAVDRRGQAYRRASRGGHIDLAAPGVEVWTAASIRGARPQTGTSFAAPFVTAAAALMLQENPDLTPADLRDRLRSSARDLGAEGQDDIYGHGLLTLPQVCGGTKEPQPEAAAPRRETSRAPDPSSSEPAPDE
ncbi:MAG: S8 family serine peptidase [Paracoccus sp. (in: a-proteobacteria)]|uniref:S8 family serine peptidase n=1 Tax=Paracoccus sp. TaxID=267 RepID=UPI0026E0149D|nr:S8 family serine peptidase [Paracoccus sp. (in: a-proteobacteria)]MDO5632319.1 S8 family serine peptidase [Paracoccus sp. (in: a-proteobacteria)]